MDLWVVAALAGAGYLTTCLKNVSRDKDNLSSADSNFQNPESPRCPLRRSTRKKHINDVNLDNGPIYHASMVDRAASEDSEILANNVDCNVLSESSMPLVFSAGEYDTDNRDGNMMSGDCLTNSLPDHSAREAVTYNFTKTRSSLRCKHLPDHFGKPRNSIESCLIAQLYKEHTKMEEYMLSSHPLPSVPLKPLLVTNGSQVISRARDNYFSTRVNSESSDTVFGVPLLPDIRSSKFAEGMKPETRKEQGRKLNNPTNQTLDGSTDEMLPFCLGICIGIISSVMTNRKEVDKMKELLKQTENLVQDLREELDMKDLLTMKELATEKFESPDNCDLPLDGRVKNVQKDEERSDSMSRIEAELEAELERLGLHVDTSSVQRRLSDHVEIDPDFIADFAQGELRADMVSRQAVGESDLDRDTSSMGTSQPADYAVSPRELSLRLYEVIEARLEERVEELETALQNSQRKMKLMESDHNNSWTEISNSRQTESIRPLVMNISGEALDAYNEAYEELMKMSHSEEDYSPSGVHYSHPEDADQSMFNEEEPVSRVEEYNDGGLSGDEGSDYDEESERLLIKQIVEKTKKGSPLLLNAQMLLFAMGQNDN